MSKKPTRARLDRWIDDFLLVLRSRYRLMRRETDLIRSLPIFEWRDEARFDAGWMEGLWETLYSIQGLFLF